MKKMDEMDREIQLRSMEWGYKAAIVSLCLWVQQLSDACTRCRVSAAALPYVMSDSMCTILITNRDEAKNGCWR